MTVTISGGVAPWELVYTNTQGDQLTLTIPTSPYTFQESPAGTTLYTLVSISDTHCVGANVSGIAAFTERAQPFGTNVQITPDPTNTFVTICFTIVGGDAATYAVAGWPGTIVGNQFCSDPIPCGQDSYQFFLEDGFGCGTDTLQGPIVCECISSAGIMDQNALSLCEFESASAPPAVATQFDANDVLEYVLHTGSGDVLGTIIAVNGAPDFIYDPATMDCGVTYYISSAVGDNDGTGMVDLSDDCLSVAVGTPVIFHCLPNVSISGGGPICLGQSTTAYFSLGFGLYDVVLHDGTQDITLTSIANSHPWTLSPTQTTTYTLVSVQSIATGCINTASGSITVTVNNPVFAGTAIAPMELCANEGPMIYLADLLTDEDMGGIWTETSATPSSGGAFNAASGTFYPVGQAPGTYKFRYFMDAQPPCFDDYETVTVIIHPKPVADAGIPQELTCDETTVTIGGSGSSAGAQYTYEWTLAGSPTVLGTQPTLLVSQPGTYQLAVINTETGCMSVDQVGVMENIAIPVLSVLTQDVSCFGYGDGVIFVESITGGKPPYLFALNNEPLSSQQQFSGLDGGDYLISVEDANGCETQVLVNIFEPAELTATLVTSIQPDAEGNYFLEWGDNLILSLLSSYPVAELDTITWSPAQFVECNDVFCSSVTVAPQEGAMFTVTVNWGPCQASDQLRLLVHKSRPVFIPNIFSPNDDGKNDVFFIQAGPQVQQIRTLMVFNRWGESIFHAENFRPNDESMGWDGAHRGKPVDPGVYAWFVEVEYTDGYVEMIKGDVSLVR
ncbi:MAG: gliding motility-associated C-terminal domain-containing protein [Saprospirales bacterium]|nr:gliding motility-associated C-terminal domain-containing protein [Saprospirales bacterium]